MTDADLHLLTGAYVLDALDDAERAAFERHLDGCGSCVDEIAGLREAAARLGAAEAVAPSPEARAATLAAAAQTPQVRPRPRVEGAAPAAHETGAPAGGSGRGRSGWWALAASVAAVLAIGSAVTAVQQDRRADRLDAQVTAVADVLAAPDAERLSAATNGDVTASVVVSAAQASAVVVGQGFAATTGEQTLQVWLVDGQAAVPAGTLTRSADGTAIGLVNGGVESGSTIAVTLEPTRHATAPTTDPLLAVEV